MKTKIVMPLLALSLVAIMVAAPTVASAGRGIDLRVGDVLDGGILDDRSGHRGGISDLVVLKALTDGKIGGVMIPTVLKGTTLGDLVILNRLLD